jgi:DNA polymerase-3 subunit epsilon
MAWFRKNKRPDYWKEYEASFRESLPQKLEEVEFVVLDTETTGLNPVKDRMLSIGAVKLIGNEIAVQDVFEVYIEQTVFSAESVPVHGIRQGHNPDMISEEKAIQKLLPYLGNAVLIAHHASFDVGMINMALKRLKLPRLKNRVVDTSDLYRRYISSVPSISLDDLCNKEGIPMHDRHTATGDAYLTALVFLKLLKQIRQKREIRLTDLFVEQDFSRGLF